MTKMLERIELPPYSKPWEYLNRAVCQISEDQGSEIVRLRVPAPGSSGLAVEKDVALQYQSATGNGANRPWLVSWVPTGGGIYPEFEGRLFVDSDEEYGVYLAIEGEYSPPLGAVGKAFDAVVGSRIAAATVREFLRSLMAKMAHEFALEQVP